MIIDAARVEFWPMKPELGPSSEKTSTVVGRDLNVPAVLVRIDSARMATSDVRRRNSAISRLSFLVSAKFSRTLSIKSGVMAITTARAMKNHTDAELRRTKYAK